MGDNPAEDHPPISTDPVLVVEDNRLNQKVALLLLERLGISAQVANNGKEAFDAVSQQRFSIILMDCHMPEMDGFEATLAIRKLEAATGGYTPIIAVTALTTANDRQRCLQVGMDDYISKPIEREILKSKIDQWLLTSMAVHNPGAAARIGRAITGGDIPMPDKDMVNFEELKEFYGESQLSDMLQSFMDGTAEQLRMVESHLHDQNTAVLAGLVNDMRASCASLGAKHLAKLCLCQQVAIARGDWVEAKEAFSSMQRAFTHSRLLFQSGVVTEENPVITDDEVLVDI